MKSCKLRYTDIWIHTETLLNLLFYIMIFLTALGKYFVVILKISYYRFLRKSDMNIVILDFSLRLV